MAINALSPSPSSSATSFHGSSARPLRQDERSLLYKIRPPDYPSRPATNTYPEKQVSKRPNNKDLVDRWRNTKTNRQGENPPVVSDFKAVLSKADKLQSRDPIFEEECDEMTTNASQSQPEFSNHSPLVENADQFSSETSDLEIRDTNSNSMIPDNSHGYQLTRGESAVIEETISSSSILQERLNVETFNALIVKEKLMLLKHVEEIPAVDVIISILQTCRDARHHSLAKFLHVYICLSGLDNVEDVGNDLVATLLECRSMALAQQVFHRLMVRTEFPWTYLIRENAECGKAELAVSMFEQIKEDGVAPSKFTYVAFLKACAKLKCAVRGQRIHLEIVKVGLDSDYYIGNMLLDVYAKCGSITEARNVFDRLLVKDAVSWTSLISGHVEKGLSKDAVDCFEQMLEKGTSPDEFVFACVLKACGSMAAREKGQEVHAHLVTEELEGDSFVGNALVDMYVKCGLLLEARDVFDYLPVQDVVSWTTLIAGFADNGFSESAIWLYLCMHEQGLSPNNTTFASMLKACSNTLDREPGRRLHAQILAMSRLQMMDAITATALIEMHAKWGCMEDAQEVFDGMQKRDLVSWNALLTGYLQQGEYISVFQLFERMKEEGIHPDQITYLCALSACSRAGLLDRGKSYFNALGNEHGVVATIKHYNCMVDLLGRAGQLKEALNMLQNMPFPPDLVAWVTLLAACQKWSDVEIGRQAFEATLKLDEMHAAAFHAMFNIYVEANMWEDAKKIEAMRASMGARKKHTKSWIEIEGSMHTFVVGGSLLSNFDYIYGKLESLCDTLEDERALQSLKRVMKGMGKSDDEDGLCGHSEVFAVLYGLINTPERTSLYVAKNANVCPDCHVVMSLLSKVENRLVSCRDACRIHTFRGGKCCCEKS